MIFFDVLLVSADLSNGGILWNLEGCIQVFQIVTEFQIFKLNKCFSIFVPCPCLCAERTIWPLCLLAEPFKKFSRFFCSTHLHPWYMCNSLIRVILIHVNEWKKLLCTNSYSVKASLEFKASHCHDDLTHGQKLSATQECDYTIIGNVIQPTLYPCLSVNNQCNNHTKAGGLNGVGSATPMIPSPNGSALATLPSGMTFDPTKVAPALFNIDFQLKRVRLVVELKYFIIKSYFIGKL